MKYQGLPVIVDAHRIRAVDPFLRNGAMGVITDDGELRSAGPEMTARFIPGVGDYWVIQQDGYEYLNPAAVFERKYAPLLNA